jgi:L-ribulose-5-phosphate 4-epimerase
MLQELKEKLLELHLELPKNNLVVWTGGNISARDPESGLVVIKASGIRYEEMRPEHMLVLDLDGKIVEGDFKPSSDTASHLYIYRHRADVGKTVLDSIGQSPAVLLRNHGVFTVGKDARSALKAAVMTEENAKTVWLALQIGTPAEIPQEDVEKLHRRYTHVYGQ